LAGGKVKSQSKPAKQLVTGPDFGLHESQAGEILSISDGRYLLSQLKEGKKIAPITLKIKTRNTWPDPGGLLERRRIRKSSHGPVRLGSASNHRTDATSVKTAKGKTGASSSVGKETPSSSPGERPPGKRRDREEITEGLAREGAKTNEEEEKEGEDLSPLARTEERKGNSSLSRGPEASWETGEGRAIVRNHSGPESSNAKNRKIEEEKQDFNSTNGRAGTESLIGSGESDRAINFLRVSSPRAQKKAGTASTVS